MFPFVVIIDSMLTFSNCHQESMEKAVKNKVAKAVVPAIDVMFQALR
jgi:hypothetical protein